MDAAKLKELAEMSGLDDTTIASLITGAVETRQKEASAEGVRLKSTSPPIPPATIYYDPDGTPGIIQNGTFVTLKAARPAEDTPPADIAPSGKAPSDAAAEAADMAEDAAEGDEGPLLLDADLDAIADRVVAKIGPALADMSMKMDMDGKMRGFTNEVKALFSGMATKTAGTEAVVNDHATRLKAAEDRVAAAEAVQAKALADLAELRGDAPAIAQRGGFYASTDPATALPTQISQAMTGKTGENGNGLTSKAGETLAWFHQVMTTGTDGSAPQAPPNI